MLFTHSKMKIYFLLLFSVVANTCLAAETNSQKPKTIFEVLDESDLNASDQLTELKDFLLAAQQQQQKKQTVPDLSPVRGRLTSVFGRRMHPFTGKPHMHFGLDLAAPMGNSIFATADGVVTAVGHISGYGLLVSIQHPNKVSTLYAHVKKAYVKKGQRVKKGDVIAAVGSSGHSTGPHVHYEIVVDGKRVDPRKYIVKW